MVQIKNKAKMIFIGDMTYEIYIFHEWQYAKNFKLPLKFVVEDNNFAAQIPTNKVEESQK